MRSCTTRWSRWFCSAVRKGLEGVEGGEASSSDEEEMEEMKVCAGSPQLCLQRLQGLGVFLLARHLQSTPAGHTSIQQPISNKHGRSSNSGSDGELF